MNTRLSLRGPGSPLEFVLSMNLQRRHLTATQRAALAVELLPMLEREAAERVKATQAKPGQQVGKAPAKLPGPNAGESRAHAARLTSVNPHYVSEAKKLKEQSPELFAAIRSRRQIKRSSFMETGRRPL